MTTLYLPVFKFACGYSVTFGRRWSLIEHLLLVEVARRRRTLPELGALSKLPPRLVVEALSNLLRAGWIELRASEDATRFGPTPAGAKRAAEEELPAQLQSNQKWASLSVDRLTGSWLRSEDLDIAYHPDLPHDALTVEPKLGTYDPRDLPRELLYLRHDEALEPSEPMFRTPSRPYARVVVDSFGEVEGLPPYASLDLRRAILNEAARLETASAPAAAGLSWTLYEAGEYADRIDADDLIVGGSAHREVLEGILDSAKSTVVIHSCFISPDTMMQLLPAFERAAKRRVRVELIWGLVLDPEDPTKRKPITESEKVLDKLPAALRSKVQMTGLSSRSHAKCIVYDTRPNGQWHAIVGSCNFLSTHFDSVDVSVRVHNPDLIAQLLGRLIATQQPSAGGWPPMTIRLDRVWNQVRRSSRDPSAGDHRVRLISDLEHHVCVTDARDLAMSADEPQRITLGCDLYGLAAETSVLTPMQTAAQAGNAVEIYYQRASRYLREEGRDPDPDAIAKRGIGLLKVPELHGKFLICREMAVVTSFNWLATALDGARARGAEIGVRIVGPDIGDLLRGKLAAASWEISEAQGATEIQPALLPLR